MNSCKVTFLWREPAAPSQFRTGVCLHGHTQHSEECLWYLPRYLHPLPGISRMVRDHDFSRAWWTPPHTPASAVALERAQIAALGLRPMISLTDHDNIEAGMSLQAACDPRGVPVSIEWTVPYERTVLHLGVHNLPPEAARRWMTVLSAYTAVPDETSLPEILSELARIPGLLTILNHPFWLEERVQPEDHHTALGRFLRECRGWLHAFELNGSRRWKENAAVIELARVHSRPVISGGDRHTSEPAACLNLTRAQSFAEFADEIRAGASSVLFLPQYRTPMPVRILEAGWDVLRPYPEYPGRERWIDRFFYRSADGTPQSLAQLWRAEVPWMVRSGARAVEFLAAPRMRAALSLLLRERVPAEAR